MDRVGQNKERKVGIARERFTDSLFEILYALLIMISEEGNDLTVIRNLNRNMEKSLKNIEAEDFKNRTQELFMKEHQRLMDEIRKDIAEDRKTIAKDLELFMRHIVSSILILTITKIPEEKKKEEEIMTEINEFFFKKKKEKRIKVLEKMKTPDEKIIR